MILPDELKTIYPVSIANGSMSDTGKLWRILTAAYHGDLLSVKNSVAECPDLIYAQYNYTPPIHFAVREGHADLVEYLLKEGAHDPGYKIYPFLDKLETLAAERGFNQIAEMLTAYAADLPAHKYSGDNGRIHFPRSAEEKEFEKAVDNGNIGFVKQLLSIHSEYALNNTFFWGEGILTMPAKVGNFEMVDLLMHYGARVPDILKWTQKYYFERFESASYMLSKGMNPNVMSWHGVTFLHDMALAGNLQKAELLLQYGAEMNSVEEEYQSTPIGLAARWGKIEMVKFLIHQGADVNKSGAAWSTPLAWSEKKGFPEIERLLINAGAKR